MTAVMSELEAGEVPSVLAYAPVASCLRRNAKELLGSDGVRKISFLVAHGMIQGGELELEEPEDFREEVDAARTAMVAALSKADGLRGAPEGERNKCSAIRVRKAVLGSETGARPEQRTRLLTVTRVLSLSEPVRHGSPIDDRCS